MSASSSSTSNATHDLTQGSISKHLYRLTLPMVWALMANFVVQATDIWFISMLGDDELTAMGFAFPIMMLVFSLSIGLSAGAASVVARFAPVKSHEQIQKMVTDTLFLCLLIGLALATIGLFTIDQTFTLIGADQRLLPLINDYMQIFFFSNIVTMVGMNALSCVRALGDSRAQASSMIWASVVNFVLDPILIFGLGPIPAMELQGAALATLIARFVTLTLAMKVVIKHQYLLTVPSKALADLMVSWRPLLHIALPAAGTNVIIPLSGAIITAMLASYGEYAVAGMGVATRIEPMMLICFYSLSAIISPFVGQNLGAKSLDRIVKSVRLASQFSMAFGAFMALLIWLLADIVIAWFTQDPQIAQVAKHYLLIVSISHGAAGVVMIVNASFNGLAKPLQATTVSIMRVLIVYLPLAYLLAQYWQEEGIFTAYAAVNFICAAFGYIWFMRTAKRLCPNC